MGLDAYDILNLCLGASYFILALVIARYIGSLGRTFPWLSLLIIFFLTRGAERIYAGLTDSERLGIAVDAVLLMVLIALILGLDRTVSALKATHDEAAFRREEYARALADYRRLARHRLGNPLAAIRGSIVTLRDLPDLDEDTRRQLLDALDEESKRLERIALDPEPRSAEERGLDPRPRVYDPDRG